MLKGMGEFDDIDDFVGRPWGKLSALKAKHWQDADAESRLQAAFELYLHARETNSEWPSDQDRRDDLQHHIEMAALFKKIDECTERDA